MSEFEAMSELDVHAVLFAFENRPQCSSATRAKRDFFCSSLKNPYRRFRHFLPLFITVPPVPINGSAARVLLLFDTVKP